jgi:mannan endo-1,4-beta-mannosidase
LLLALLAPASPAAERPIDLGVYYCPRESCDATNSATLDAYEQRFSRYPSIALNFRNLDQPLFYPGEEEGLRARGVTPMITVEPLVTRGREVELPLAAIANGRYDDEIRADARIAAAYDGEVLLRFAQEMNGAWFPRRSADPQAFVATWIRFVRIFREMGATNVKFVWTPSVEKTRTRPMEDYFPGEEYVDYVGLDGYSWSGSRPQSFAEVFASSYQRLRRLSAKPVMIGETGAAPGPERAAWIRDGFLRELPRFFPAVVAVVWFSKDLSAIGQRDWRIDTDDESVAAWREVTNSTLYGGTEPIAETEPEQPKAAPPKAPKADPKSQSAMELLVRLWRFYVEAVKGLVGAP